MVKDVLAIGGSYLLGAMPFGVWIAKMFYHVDIREHGSKNTGATNVWRVLGAKPGLATFALDFFKGFLPVLLAKKFTVAEPALPVFCGVAAIIGHNWSLFLRGKGGKGVATSAGVFIALLPVHTAIAILVFALVFGFSKRISVGSMASAGALVLCTFVLETPIIYRIVSVLASLMILLKHVPNIKRLAKGEEPKVNIR